MTDHLRRSISSGKDSSQNMPQGIAEAHNQTTAEVADSPDRQPDLALDIQALQILDSSDDCIKVLDLDGRILFMSRGGQVLLGIQEIAPLLNTSWIEFWQGADQQAASEAIAKARAGEVCTFQGYGPTPSGEPKWWDIKISPIRGTEGQVERLLCISRDITERRQINQLAQIRVIDMGKGISPDFLPHVFEYFRQADATTTRKFGGLGLGLAIVKQIVEMHGGTVKAESLGENQGATFTVQLPVMQQPPSPVLEPSYAKTANQETPLSNLQILVVDDDDDTREFQTFLLEQNGARVIAVASGLEALQVLDRCIPDVLVSDVGMAQMDGYMLIQQIRSRPHDRGGMIPAIALTAYAAEVDQQKALQVGFQTHITKPVESEALVGAIVSLLRSDR